jgi:hypothetical protein
MRYIKNILVDDYRRELVVIWSDGKTETFEIKEMDVTSILFGKGCYD